MFTLPETFVADLTTAGQSVLTDYSDVITLIVGLILGFWVVNKVIGIISSRAKSRA